MWWQLREMNLKQKMLFIFSLKNQTKPDILVHSHEAYVWHYNSCFRRVMVSFWNKHDCLWKTCLFIPWYFPTWIQCVRIIHISISLFHLLQHIPFPTSCIWKTKPNQNKRGRANSLHPSCLSKCKCGAKHLSLDIPHPWPYIYRKVNRPPSRAINCQWLSLLSHH